MVVGATVVVVDPACVVVVVLGRVVVVVGHVSVAGRGRQTRVSLSESTPFAPSGFALRVIARFPGLVFFLPRTGTTTSMKPPQSAPLSPAGGGIPSVGGPILRLRSAAGAWQPATSWLMHTWTRKLQLPL